MSSKSGFESSPKFHRIGSIIRVESSCGSHQLDEFGGVSGEESGIFERLLLHVGKYAIARVRDVIKEGSPHSDVVDGAGKSIYIRAPIQLYGVEHLILSDVARRTCYDTSGGIRCHLHRANHSKVDDRRVQGASCSGVSVL